MLYVTVRVSVPVFPAASLAVAVKTLLPDCKVIPFAVQEVVPDAVPEPPRELAHVTEVTAVLSDAVPPKLIAEEVVV